MKYLLVTIAALVLVGCSSSPDHAGTYIFSVPETDLSLILELNPDGSFIGEPSDNEEERATGSWKVEGNLLVCEGTTTEKRSQKITIKFHKTSGKLNSISSDGIDKPIAELNPDGTDGIYIKKVSQDVAQELKDKSAQKRLKQLDEGKKRSSELLVKSIRRALDSYRSDVGSYPTKKEGGLMTLIKKPKYKNKDIGTKWRGPYVHPSFDLKDPWGNRLIYESEGKNFKQNEGSDYILYSIGPNGIKGDEDDIGNIITEELKAEEK